RHCYVFRRRLALHSSILRHFSGNYVARVLENPPPGTHPTMNLTTIREEFPALKDRVFLDAACVSLAARSTVDAVRDFLDIALLSPARSSTEHHIALDQMREQARPEVAAFLSCHEDEIALVESTSHALNLAAEAVPLTRGDRVLLSDMEFMEVGIPWC